MSTARRKFVEYHVTRPWENRGQTHTQSMGKFLEDGFSEALERFTLDNTEKLPVIPDDEAEDFDEKLDARDAEAIRLFTEDFKDNWNRYSEDWPSPAGVVPVVEIVAVHDHYPEQGAA